MPAATHSVSVESLKGQAVMKQLKETVSQIQFGIGQRIYETCAKGELPQPQTLLGDEELVMLKRRIYALRPSSLLPPIVTHNMADDANDPILSQLRRLRLFNHHDDRVKIVFHPEFLSSSNAFFDIDYDDFVRGCHLGVFPSYYEPWGYTPAECTVMGVPSVTTNLSGFGCFIEENIDEPSEFGIYIVDRRMKSIEESIQQLADIIFTFSHKSRRQRINQRNRCERLSDLLDWNKMGLEYVKARLLALRRAYPSAFSSSDSIDLTISEDAEDTSIDASAVAETFDSNRNLYSPTSANFEEESQLDALTNLQLNPQHDFLRVSVNLVKPSATSATASSQPALQADAKVIQIRPIITFNPTTPSATDDLEKHKNGLDEMLKESCKESEQRRGQSRERQISPGPTVTNANVSSAPVTASPGTNSKQAKVHSTVSPPPT